jgi:hypothetical protein
MRRASLRVDVIQRLAPERVRRETTAETLRFARRTLAPDEWLKTLLEEVS